MDEFPFSSGVVYIERSHIRHNRPVVYGCQPFTLDLFMSRILVIGCVSFDTVHLENQNDGGEKSHQTVGGAALYTALAAARVGAEVTLYAPRPEPMPEILLPVTAALQWIGPPITLAQMPSLEIVHHGHDRATLVRASWGAEHLLDPESLKALVLDTHFDIAHIAALSTVSRQLEFMSFLQGTKLNQVVSAGTYARAIEADSAGVKELLSGVDAFFMNSNEAKMLFAGEKILPKEYQLIFVTDGAGGADVYFSDQADALPEHVDAEVVDVVDPTGAGDSFCGAALAGLTLYVSPIAAAQVGTLVASRSIEHVGPQIYFIEEESEMLTSES